MSSKRAGVYFKKRRRRRFLTGVPRQMGGGKMSRDASRRVSQNPTTPTVSQVDNACRWAERWPPQLPPPGVTAVRRTGERARALTGNGSHCQLAEVGVVGVDQPWLSEPRRHCFVRAGGLPGGRFNPVYRSRSGQKARPPRDKAVSSPHSSPGLDARRLEKYPCYSISTGI